MRNVLSFVVTTNVRLIELQLAGSNNCSLFAIDHYPSLFQRPKSGISPSAQARIGKVESITI